MVIAGADVHVAAQAAVIVAHHDDDLAMGLQIDDAVGYVNAGFLQPARPADVGGLVETRLQLDHHRDLLAVLRRVDQVIDNLGVGRGAVQRHLDRAHLGVAAGFAQQALDRGRKGFVGVMQQDRADDREWRGRYSAYVRAWGDRSGGAADHAAPGSRDRSGSAGRVSTAGLSFRTRRFRPVPSSAASMPRRVGSMSCCTTTRTILAKRRWRTSDSITASRSSAGLRRARCWRCA